MPQPLCNNTAFAVFRHREENLSTNPSNARLWTGRILSALPILFMLSTVLMCLSKPALCEASSKQLGYSAAAMQWLAFVEIACVLLYAIPQTAVFGALLLTAYFGGATATHVRLGQPFFAPIIVCIVVWAGLYLREPRLSALLPLRKSA